jgi:uncharacterized MAPEG superfamily protein
MWKLVRENMENSIYEFYRYIIFTIIFVKLFLLNYLNIRSFVQLEKDACDIAMLHH